MPFRNPFKLNFENGDLIYGLAPERPNLVKHFGVQIINAGGVATVDQYRKNLVQQGGHKIWQEFLRANEVHRKYNKYMVMIRAFNSDEELFSESATPEKINAAWRAKSKFGMEWTIGQQRGHVHFVLDGIDMGAVVTKTHLFEDENGAVLARDSPRGKPFDTHAKERTITHSELRWIYRNRDNPLVQERVQFWQLAGFIRPCVPPWENHTNMTSFPSGRVISWATAWREYAPATVRAAF